MEQDAEPLEIPQERVLDIERRGVLRRDFHNWLAILPRGGAELGVTRGYVFRMMDEYRLTTEDLNCILSARANYQAGVPAIRRFLAKGLTMVDILGAYQAREAILNLLPDYLHISVIGITRFADTFVSYPCDFDELGETICEAHSALHEILPWVKGPGHSIQILCQAAKFYGLTDHRAVIEAIEMRRKVHDHTTTAEDDAEDGVDDGD